MCFSISSAMSFRRCSTSFAGIFPPLIGPRVIASGGTPADLVMMLAGIVQSTMRRYIREDLHEEFLKAVSTARADLSGMKQS